MILGMATASTPAFQTVDEAFSYFRVQSRLRALKAERAESALTPAENEERRADLEFRKRFSSPQD